MASRPSDSANSVVLCVQYYVYALVLYVYRVLYYCFDDILGYIHKHNSEVPDNLHYRTTHSPY
jgi:hypothetical protein